MTVPPIKLCPKGPTVSRLVAGAWRLADGECDIAAWLTACLEIGITTFDHADIYGDHSCELLFGNVWPNVISSRSSLQFVSKCGIALPSNSRPGNRIKHYDTSAAYIIESARRSLRNLKTDYLDILLIHRPDPLMDADDMARAFETLRQAGDVRHFGVSNFTPSQFRLLQSRCSFPLVTNQIELSVLHVAPLHDGSLDVLQEQRTAPMAWSPLAGGRLFDAADERAGRVRAALEQVGRELEGASVEQVALAWLLRHPANVVPVLGTLKPERIRDAAGALMRTLDRQQWFTIWSASAGREVP